MTSFVNIFGGSTIQASQVAYRAVALDTVPVQLEWPSASVTATDVAARTMDVTSSMGGGIIMPAADAASVGYDFLISNVGANAFTVQDFDLNAIATVAVGEVKYLQITDNSTEAGTWRVILFGSVVNAADAASLAGSGLTVIGSMLAASEPVHVLSAGVTIVEADRAQVLVWDSGTGTYTLPPAAGLGDGFYFDVRNQGTGALAIVADGAETIDDASTITLQPADSARVHCSGAGWHTVGRGRSTQFNFSLLVKNITGGTVTLTPTEAANTVQRYTGVLVSNANVVFPPVVQVYYVSNLTSGAHTVTFKTAAGGTPDVFAVAQGTNAVLFCDGTNVYNATTTSLGTTNVLTLQAGTVGAPPLNFAGDLTTGVYQPAAGQIGFTSVGSNILTLTGAAATFAVQPKYAVAPSVAADLANKAYVDSVVPGGAGAGTVAQNPVDITASRALVAADFGTGVMRINAAGVVAITVPTVAAMSLPVTAGKLRTIAFECYGAGIPTFAGATSSTSINGQAGPTTKTPIGGAPVRYQFVVLTQLAPSSDAWSLV